MKAWLQRLLGTYDVDERLKAIEMQMHQYKGLISGIRLNSGAQNMALGRIIAKLDPNYGIPEDDKARRAASDMLGEQVIKKLEGEFKASNKYSGEFE